MPTNKDLNLPLIEVKNLSFSYDKELILEDINIEVYERDFLVIIGPNGGGKSTLMKLLLEIHKPDIGNINFLKQDINEKDKNTAYVPQNTNVNINFPIKAIEVVMMGSKPKKLPFFGYKKEELNYALEILKKVGIEKFAESKIGSLSGGQRQRVLIARALYSNPKILLLDEPTSNIDADGQKAIYELLKELNKEVTILVISHDLSIILGYASKVAHINKKLLYHDITVLKKEFIHKDEHICEIELLQMLGNCRC